MADHESSRARGAAIAMLAIAALAFALQLAVVRPLSWPAGAGLTLSNDDVLVPFGMPTTLPRVRPPDVSRPRGPVTVADVHPAGAAARAGMAPGDRILRVRSASGRDIDLAVGLPDEREAALHAWRDAYWLGVSEPITVTFARGGAAREVTLDRQAVWSLDNATRLAWLRLHGGTLLETAAFLAGALVLVALGTRGMTAALMTLALIATATANSGSLMGAERTIPLLGGLLVLFGWLITPVTFPIIGLAVLYFPTRAEILDRHLWIVPAMLAAAAPMLIVSLAAAAFLLGLDATTPALTWLAANAWTFDASFAAALAANVLIVIEGIQRYRRNLDQNERRRIQFVVFTGVPAVFAYAVRAGVPLMASVVGRPLPLHWLLETMLQAVMLLPAFGLPYVVAVKHVFSPRTVLRRSLQYALARRTLSLLVALPIAVFAIALIVQRDRPLGDIVLGQPISR